MRSPVLLYHPPALFSVINMFLPHTILRARSSRHRLDTWRTGDNRLVCFYCHTSDHFYCRTLCYVIWFSHRRFLAESSCHSHLTDDTASEPSAIAGCYEPQCFINVPPTLPLGTLQYDSHSTRFLVFFILVLSISKQ